MTCETLPPPEVRDLLQTAILSIEELEVLLRLRAARNAQTPAELAEAHNIPESIAESAVACLERAGLVTGANRGKQRAYSFAPHTATLEAAVTSLASYYRENRMQVILTICNNSIERMRHDVLQRFSDAFRISRDPKKR